MKWLRIIFIHAIPFDLCLDGKFAYFRNKTVHIARNESLDGTNKIVILPATFWTLFKLSVHSKHSVHLSQRISILSSFLHENVQKCFSNCWLFSALIWANTRWFISLKKMNVKSASFYSIHQAIKDCFAENEF